MFGDTYKLKCLVFQTVLCRFSNLIVLIQMKDRLKERREQRRKAEEERVRKESDDRYSTRSDSFSSGGSRPTTRDSAAVTKTFLLFFHADRLNPQQINTSSKQLNLKDMFMFKATSN